MNQTRWVAPLATIALALSACAGGAVPQGTSPADLPTLEAALKRNPGDAALMTRVGIANYDAKAYARSRDVLNGALTLNRQNYAGNVYLGLAFEELGQFDSARVAYRNASAVARTDQQRGEIDNHLVLLTRRELRQAARDAIAQEATLSTEAPKANSVAVFPFRYVGIKEELRPLARGLTHLMVSDLSKLSKLTLLERERVQSLVDELQLSESGRVDPSTAARSGRLLRAAEVIQGSVSEVTGRTDLRFDATVVDAVDASVVATGTGSDQLQQLFALEKQVLFRLLDQMKIGLTPAERRDLSERPTADMQAFLAFSRGLEAEDRGDYVAAEAGYSAALTRDPNFRQAKERRAASQRAAIALQTPARTLAGLSPEGGLGDNGPGGVAEPAGATGGTPAGGATTLRNGVLNTIPTVGSALANRVGGDNEAPDSRQPGTRAPLPEVINDNPTQPGLAATVTVIITRP